MEKKSISVVVPCFNEGKTIFEKIKKIQNYLKENFPLFEIIAVNDGSADNTEAELKRLQREIPLEIISEEKNEGKGSAVKKGMLKSRFEIVMFLDADLGIPIEHLADFVKTLEVGNDLVIASRFVSGSRVDIPVRWHRKFMEQVFRLLRMVIIDNYSIADTQCGFKVFTRQAAHAIFSKARIKRFAFDSEIIFLSGLYGFKIKEFPIFLQNPAKSSIRLLFDPCNMIFDLFRIRLNAARGYYVKNNQ